MSSAKRRMTEMKAKLEAKENAAEIAATTRAELAERRLQQLVIDTTRKEIADAQARGYGLGYDKGWQAAKQRYGWWQRLRERLRGK